MLLRALGAAQHPNKLPTSEFSYIFVAQTQFALGKSKLGC
jgi:hypothetical protein